MNKKTLIYSDLSRNQLQQLKELYIKKKVDSMNENELKDFVLEIISHQINETVGKEEEMEAWKEMSIFFGDNFEIIVQEIQKQYKDDGKFRDSDENPQKQRLELLEKNNIEKEKKDMWQD
tara:strand:+ start:117 stop:476 length:360 start_codon:yes stop_codon:yes gene_type:complete